MITAEKQSVTISNQSIINELRAYTDKPEDSIIEYVWNSFDAKANRVDIVYSFSRQIDGVAFSKPTLSIADDGEGWDLSETSTIKIFLESRKRHLKKPYKSLPHGSKGVGRFTFFSFAKSATWSTNHDGQNYRLVLEKEDLNNYLLNQNAIESTRKTKGTTVSFEVTSDKLHENFFASTLRDRILSKMAWFFILYPNKKVYINNTYVDPEDYIGELVDTSIKVNNKDIPLKMIRWKSTLADKENSKLYYIDSEGNEVFKKPTGLNNKADIFYHSAYVKSKDFDGFVPVEADSRDEEDIQSRLLDGEQSKLINDTKEETYQKLIDFRQPHIESSSDELIEEWRKNEQYPDVTQYGVDPEQYHDLIKQTFISSPGMYLGVSHEHRKLILNLLASLLGSSDRDLILIILNQVYDLDDTEKKTLQEILERTSLKNILSTVKELEHRLQVIDDLDKLLHDPDFFKDTLEVEHLQKIVNDSFWIFGDEFQLVMDTEGSIRTAIKKWAKEILSIDDFVPESSSRKELDLLISKKIEYGNGKILNIVVELKRPSIKLSDKEYSQISNYRDQLLKEPACNGDNIHWLFILIGTNYDQSIERKIESQKAWGERDKGLTEYVENENTKIYVRKWTDVINGELRPRYRNLSDKLRINLKKRDNNSQDDIVKSLLGNENAKK